MTIFNLARMPRIRLVHLYVELASKDSRYSPALVSGMSSDALAAAIAEMQEHPQPRRGR